MRRFSRTSEPPFIQSVASLALANSRPKRADAPQEGRRADLQRVGLSAEALENWSTAISEGASALDSYDIPEVWKKLVRDWHACCSFAVAGSKRRIHTFSGVRPGDPLAHVVFCMIFRKVQTEVKRRLAEAGLEVILERAGTSMFAEGKGKKSLSPLPRLLMLMTSPSCCVTACPKRCVETLERRRPS